MVSMIALTYRPPSVEVPMLVVAQDLILGSIVENRKFGEWLGDLLHPGYVLFFITWRGNRAKPFPKRSIDSLGDGFTGCRAQSPGELIGFRVLNMQRHVHGIRRMYINVPKISG
jgi:hypothetical protein